MMLCFSIAIMAIINRNMELVVAEVAMAQLAHHRLLWLVGILVTQAHLVSIKFSDSFHTTIIWCGFSPGENTIYATHKRI